MESVVPLATDLFVDNYLKEKRPKLSDLSFIFSIAYAWSDDEEE